MSSSPNDDCSEVEHDVVAYQKDRLAIADLMTGWMHRDVGRWDDLLHLFHEDGVIEVTWFEGKFVDFVAASKKMGTSSFKNKHVITSPFISFNGSRAIAETNAMIVGENIDLGIGCVSHNRFYDRIEKRDGIWKIVNRQSIYDMGSFTFPAGNRNIDADIVGRYPREYAPLGYVLEKSGFPVRRLFATKGSDLEITMKAGGQQWLDE